MTGPVRDELKSLPPIEHVPVSILVLDKSTLVVPLSMFNPSLLTLEKILVPVMNVVHAWFASFRVVVRLLENVVTFPIQLKRPWTKLEIQSKTIPKRK